MAATPERRRGGDRRDPSRPAVAPGPERRSGNSRRRLPEPRWRRWPSIAAAAVLGVGAAFALQGLQADASAVAPAVVTPLRLAPPAARPAISLAEAQALHDEAAMLTPAGVAFDERAHATWSLRLGALEAAAGDPQVAPEVRDELRATLQTLADLGIGRGAP